MGEPPRRIWARLVAPVDIASLVVFRVCFGALMAWEAYQYLVLGRVAGKYAEPETLLPWAGFEWVARWPGDGMYFHFYALLALGVCIAAGLAYRVACLLFCLGFSYVLLVSQAFFQNHFYLICLLSLLLVFIPAHRSASLDARLRPSLRSESAPAWGVWLLRAQLGIVYFFGGVAKLNGDWLRGYPMRVWLPEHASLPFLGPIFEEPGVAIAMSWSGLLIDLLAFPALLWRRTRLAAFAVLVTFHLWNSQLFSIGVFPWLAIAATTIFLDPGWPRRIFNWPRREPIQEPPGFTWTPVRRAGAALAGVYLVVQLLVPLRHHLYPGNASWTGEGHEFAWRMMLINMRGVVEYELVEPVSGRSWRVDPQETLGAAQYQRLGANAQLIHLLAQEIARSASVAAGRPMEVRAHAWSSLNGRRPQPLIDPEIDLAAEPVTILGHQHSITRLEEPLGTAWRKAVEPDGGGTPGRR